MPKSSKKKKDKAADFSKAKLKLGKGKQTASNVIDTSFKARSIALPTQSIAAEKDTAPTTKRRQTLDTLVIHLRHYNATTRRDAIHGLRELLDAHPELINAHLTTLVNSCVRIIGDEDATVRKALLPFFAWLFRQVPRDELIPHSPVLLLFTTSAQTHIFPEIRIDAVRFLDIFLEYIPDVVTEGWAQHGSDGHGRRVLEGYLGILNAGTAFGEGGDAGPVQATSTASVVLSPASKLVVLKSLAAFLDHAVSEIDSAGIVAGEASSATLETPTWYFSSSFSSSSAFEIFDSQLRPASNPSQVSERRHTRSSITKAWYPEISDGNTEDFVGRFDLSRSEIASWSLQELQNVAAAIALLDDNQSDGAGLDTLVTSIAHIARTLHSTLVSTFLDCAPAVFSPSSTPPEIELQMVLVVCRICRSIYGKILQNPLESVHAPETAEADLQVIIAYLSPYFPFTINGSVTARRDIKVEQAFQELNLMFCELSSFLVLSHDRRTTPLHRNHSCHPRSSRSTQKAATRSPSDYRRVERVSEYIVQLLRGETPSGSQKSISRPITPQAYVSLLPTIWSLINVGTSDAPEAAASLFSAVIAHAVKASSTSAVKRHTIDFIGRLVLLDREPQYTGAFKVGRDGEQDAQLEDWLLQLPKTMWELGSTHPATTESIALLLLRLSQRRSRLLHAKAYTSLRSRLTPYFIVKHSVRGQLDGPYSKLPTNSPLRRLILDLVATLASQCRAKMSLDGDEFMSAVNEAVDDTPESRYLSDVTASMSW
ncbi:hypothetical protein C8Q79DRAFT_898200 [Trametes meyenii]|nr:hypothetical protein C8Q79DRAFT_898200 [Trametes meyenii]